MGLQGVATMVVAALLLVGLAGCAKEQATAAEEIGGDGLTLQGVVVDDALRPLAAIKVTAGDGENVTDSEGRFTFEGLSAGVYVVKAVKAGYADAVTQVLLADGQELPLVKLVLTTDASSLAYVEVYSIDGFVECGIYFVVGYFAACSGPNTVSAIACPATGVCAGNLTGDRSLILLPMVRAPAWVQMEAVWEPTTATGEFMMVQSGATSQAEVAEGGVRIINETVGPSPNLNIIAGKDLDESRLGAEVGSLLYMRLHTAPNPPAGAGLAVEQPFKLLIHVFYGYTPSPGWRFSVDGDAPPPA